MSNDPNTTRLDDMINDLAHDLEITLSNYGLEHYTDALVDQLEAIGAFGEDS